MKRRCARSATTCSTPRAPAAGARRSTSRRRPRSSPPAPAARWPSTATARRPGRRAGPTCSRRSGARIDLAPERGRRAASTRSASASCSRPPTTRRRASSSRCARSSRVRTIFNFLGPLTNPAGARRQLIGVSDPAYLERDGGRAGAAGRRPCVGSVQRGWARRDEHVRRRRTSSRSTASAIERYTSSPEDVGLAPAPRRRHRRRHARATTPPTTRAILAGEPRPRARPRRAQRRRRDLRRRPAPTPSATACAAAAGAIDSGAAARSARAPTSRSRELATGMSVLDRIVDATRADVGAARRERCRWPSSSARLAGRARTGRSPRR